MKPSYKIWAMVAATLVVLRLTITLRTGTISGDDTWLLVRCFGWWHDGDFLPLLSTGGSKGFLYVGYHHIAWATLAGLCHFRLGPLFLIHAVLMVTPALLLGWQLRGRSEARWAVLLGLSSPLMAYFSLQLLPLWWIASFGGIVALQVAAREDQGKPVGPLGLLLVGLIGGYMCSVYPSLTPLTLGLFFWLLFKRKTRYAQGAYLAGCVAGYAPCAVLLVSRWAELNPQPVVTQAPLAWAPLLGGIFRYIGTPSVDFMNSPGVWMARENNLRTVTVAVWLLLFVAWIFAMIRAQRAGRLLPGSVLLAACSFAVFIPFTLITRTESWYHQAVNLWWIPILIVPWLAYELIPRQARVALAAVVAFNLVGLLVVFGPRLRAGTTTEEAYSNHGRGPSWWMQERIADQIVARAQKEIAAGVDAPLAVQTSGIYFLTTSLPILIHVQHPELTEKVKWVGENWPRFDLRVMRDRRSSHRLRLVDWPGTWHRPGQIARNAVHVTSGIAYDHTIQVSVDLLDARQDTIEVVDAEGNAVPFCRELGGMDEHRLWLRLAKLGKGVSTLWVYHGGMRDAAQAEKKPQEIFDFFEGFDDDLRGWETVGNGVWSVSDGVCRPILPATEEDNTSAWLLIKNLETNQGLLEARLRYVQFPAKIDAGIAFAVRRDDTSYLWNLNGYGVTVFSKFDGKGTPLPYSIAASSWFWKAKAGRWSVIGAQWNGSLVKASVDGRTVIDIISPGESGLGRIGLGAKRGTGVLTIEYDWVRLRTNFSNLPPSVAVEPEEWFQ